MPVEHGSGTVLVLIVLGALLAATTGGLVLAQAVVASHRARVAADLAALAGATALRDGSSSPCARGAAVAADNGATVRSCRAGGLVVEMVVAVAVRGWPDPATARSRAGPAAPPG
ncbi:MAG: Rv3654c family TadE-like protein [Terracoccus sp.]